MVYVVNNGLRQSNLLFGGVIKLMWPAFTQKYVDLARWSKKLPTPGLVVKADGS